MSEADAIANAAVREDMNVMVTKLDARQLNLFHRMFGEYVPNEKLKLAHDVVQRTLQKMEKSK